MPGQTLVKAAGQISIQRPGQTARQGAHQGAHQGVHLGAPGAASAQGGRMINQTSARAAPGSAALHPGSPRPDHPHSDTTRSSPTRADLAKALTDFAQRPKEGNNVPRPAPRARAIGHPVNNTLDASWDRALATGRIHPDRTIDLHGFTLSTAHMWLDRGIANAVRDDIRVILLVTGRAPRAGTSRLDLPLRGIIRASVGDWLAASPYRDRIAAIRNAHPRHGGAGALYLIFRRARG
jgi:DNA-nicking Smr family endonuclease